MLNVCQAMTCDLTVRTIDPHGVEAYLEKRLSLPFAPFVGLDLALDGQDLNYVSVTSCMWDTVGRAWRVDLAEEDIPEPAAAFAARTGWKVREDL